MRRKHIIAGVLVVAVAALITIWGNPVPVTQEPWRHVDAGDLATDSELLEAFKRLVLLDEEGGPVAFVGRRETALRIAMVGASIDEPWVAPTRDVLRNFTGLNVEFREEDGGENVLIVFDTLRRLTDPNSAFAAGNRARLEQQRRGRSNSWTYAEGHLTGRNIVVIAVDAGGARTEAAVAHELMRLLGFDGVLPERPLDSTLHSRGTARWFTVNDLVLMRAYYDPRAQDPNAFVLSNLIDNILPELASKVRRSADPIATLAQR